MEQPQSVPMDGASPASNGNGTAMGGDPAMGSDPAMGGDPAMGSDPAIGGDPAMGGDPATEDGGDDSTISIINQLSPSDKEAVRAYAESMLSRSESNNENGTDMADGSIEEDPMMESVVFTKKQLKKINESFRSTNNKEDDTKTVLNKKKSQTVSKKSPFNSPNFK